MVCEVWRRVSISQRFSFTYVRMEMETFRRPSFCRPGTRCGVVYKRHGLATSVQSRTENSMCGA